jgi:hypothetical protein
MFHSRRRHDAAAGLRLSATATQQQACHFDIADAIRADSAAYAAL